ncbi:MAG: DUF4398 domain-containing protein [Acidobacteria bacterium]|nr:DUF4398 domain-containing protein [Acidobacteriota bacterium]
MQLAIRNGRYFILFLLILFSISLSRTAHCQTPKGNVDEISVVTFFPDKKTSVVMANDATYPGVRGDYKVDLNERGIATIEVNLKKLPSVFDLQGTFSTYVLWAVLDDGSTVFLRQIPSSKEETVDRDFKDEFSRGKSFALVLTAEPHHMVREPSRTIILRSGPAVGDNANRTSPKKVQYQLSENDYFQDRPKVDKKKDKEYREFRRTPLSLLGARYAVTMASNAGADTEASKLLNEARDSLNKVNQLWQQKGNEKEIESLANITIGLAANAEKKAIESRRVQKIDQEKSRAASALDESVDELRQANEKIERLTEELNTVRARRDSLERDYLNKESQSNRLEKDARDAVKKAEDFAAENLELRIDIEKLKDEVQRYRAAKEFLDEMPVLEGFLKTFGVVQKKPNGLVLTINEPYWMQPDSAEFATENLERLETLAKKIADSKFIRIQISSFSTATGENVPAGQAFAEIRGAAIREYFKKFGVDPKRMTAKAFVQGPLAGKPKKGLPINLNWIEIDFASLD